MTFDQAQQLIEVAVWTAGFLAFALGFNAGRQR